MSTTSLACFSPSPEASGFYGGDGNAQFIFSCALAVVVAVVMTVSTSGKKRIKDLDFFPPFVGLLLITTF